MKLHEPKTEFIAEAVVKMNWLNGRRSSLRTQWSGVVCALLFAYAAHAQPYWVQDAGGLGNEHVSDVQVDVDGSLYVTGEYSGTLQFGGQSLANVGGMDAFVARLDPAGNVLWIKRGAGPGIDRGLKLAVGYGAAIAVAGEFMGTANLFGTSLTSAGGSTDMFVALVNKTDGTLQWVRQGGGSTGTDSPDGVSMATDGSVAVAGSFRGNAQWEGVSLVSVNDPVTGLPTADVFIANYSSTGSLLWIKQGAADKDDQAVEVVHDASGNLYVTGQYSDTITFGQTYPNALANASFLMRLTPDGTETWFRRMGGATYNHVRDIAFSSSGDLLVAGDLQGTMVWTGSTNVNIPASGLYAYYLLKVDSDGQLLEQFSQGSASGVTVRSIDAHDSTSAVLGAFNCQFTDLASHYGGNGLFMATGTQDLFIAKHALNDLSLQEAQQFGGVSAKVPGGLCFLPGGDLVFSGSFQQKLIFPAVPGFTADISTGANSIYGNGVSSYCNDPNYGYYAGSLSMGLADGFIARGYVQGREPYDWWLRSGTACLRDPNVLFIGEQSTDPPLDTIALCLPDSLRAFTGVSFSSFPYANYLGPSLSFQWSTGATNSAIWVTAPGTYWVSVASSNGCWLWTDTLEVVMLPVPSVPTIVSDGVINTATIPPSIQLCEPETHWLWATGIPADCSFSWEGPPDHIPVTNDSIFVDTAGAYQFSIINAQGCGLTLPILVHDDPFVSLQGLDMTMAVQFSQDVDLNDTIDICPGGFASYGYVPSWTMNGVSISAPPAGVNIHWEIAPNYPAIIADAGPQSAAMPILEGGWRTFDLVVLLDNKPCGTDSMFIHGVDSIYFNLAPDMIVPVALTGPTMICDGDTAVFTATCGICDSLVWDSNSGMRLGEANYVVWDPGGVLVTGYYTGTNGCTYAGYGFTIVTMPTGPLLNVSPSDGILCPGSAATITTASQGTDVVWYGPFGPITGLGTTLTTNAPGTYYLTMTVDGCPVTSNNVTITQYGTPFLALSGGQALCYPGDEVNLQVMTVPGATVQWGAPLSGNALTQIVDQPGTYTCSVSACGITTPLSLEVVYAPVQAALLNSEPFVLCPGDTLLLQGSDTSYSYTWLPGMQAGDQLAVITPGTFQLLASNALGCSDTSDAFTVNAVVFSDSLTAIGDTVCAGDTAFLSATGGGSIFWYADSSLSTQLGSGSPFEYAPMASTALFASQQQDGCASAPVSVWLEVLPRPDSPVLSGPDSLCAGDALLITASAMDSLLCSWSTPFGLVQGGSVSVAAVSLADMGNYVCTVTDQGCTSSPATHHLMVYAPEASGLPDEASFCTGGSVTLQLPPSFSNVAWSTGSLANGVIITAPMEVSVQASDVHGCTVQALVHVVVENCEVVVPNVFSPNGDGINDQWLPTGDFSRANARIWNRWGNLMFTGVLAKQGWDGRQALSGVRCSDGTYFYELDIITDGSVVKHFAGSIELLGSRP